MDASPVTSWLANEVETLEPWKNHRRIPLSELKTDQFLTWSINIPDASSHPSNNIQNPQETSGLVKIRYTELGSISGRAHLHNPDNTVVVFCFGMKTWDFIFISLNGSSQRPTVTIRVECWQLTHSFGIDFICSCMFRHLQRDENSVLSQQSVELHDQIYKPADVSNTYSLIFPTSLFYIIVLRAEALGQSSVENGPKDSFVQSLSALQGDSLIFLRLAPPGGHL